ncbi:MAG: hypothetical protein ACLP7Q_25135 [Isosphaeraceae bacterium]
MRSLARWFATALVLGTFADLAALAQQRCPFTVFDTTTAKNTELAPTADDAKVNRLAPTSSPWLFADLGSTKQPASPLWRPPCSELMNVGAKAAPATSPDAMALKSFAIWAPITTKEALPAAGPVVKPNVLKPMGLEGTRFQEDTAKCEVKSFAGSLELSTRQNLQGGAVKP